MSYIEIQTTQNIRLEYETASMGERMVAALLDRLLFVLWAILWSYIISALNLNMSALLVVIIGAPILFYFLFCELVFNGQSVGKRVMNIRVVKTEGTSPSFGDYFLRWVFRLIDNVGIAITCMMFTPKCQRLGDLAAKTCVVRTKNRAKLITAPKTDAEYRVTYDTAILLSDRDAELIAQIISNPATIRNKSGLKKLADKVKEITKTTSDAHELAYLKRILTDYRYLAGRL